MKTFYLGDQKLPPSTGPPNCQILAVWPTCVRWQTCDFLDEIFSFWCFGIPTRPTQMFSPKFPFRTFFLPYVFFKPTIEEVMWFWPKITCEKITTSRKNLDHFQIYGVSGESCKVKPHELRTKCTTYISKQQYYLHKYYIIVWYY